MVTDDRLRRSAQRLQVLNGLLLTLVALLAVLLWRDRSLPQVPAARPRSESPSQTGAFERPSESSSAVANDEPPLLPVSAPRGDIGESEQALTRLFKSAAPSVVHITTHRVERDFFTLDLQKIPRGSGTGFVWDKAGHIVTNFHVIRDADIAYVAFDDNRSLSAELIGVAPEKDLAVLRVASSPEQLQPLPLGTSHDLEVGLTALAIGNPFGLDHTLTTGVVSALGREIESETGQPITDVIQTDAAINPGNSGGPLLDSGGRLIGVNTAIFSPSGAYAGIGFAIPVDTVKWAVPELIRHGRIIRPTLAIVIAAERIAARLGLSGVLILEVEPRSAAAAAGLRPTRRTVDGEVLLGDIIVALDETPIRNRNDLLFALEKYRAGDRVQVKILRGSQEQSVEVELESAE